MAQKLEISPAAESAVEAPFRRDYEDQLVHVSSRVGDPELAREALQEAYAKALRRPDEFLVHPTPERWILRVALNHAIDDLRRRHRFKKLIPRLTTRSSSRSDLDDLELKMDVDEFRREIAPLPDGQRRVLELRYVDELSVREISEVIGSSEGTVKSQLSDARTSYLNRHAGPADVDETSGRS